MNLIIILLQQKWTRAVGILTHSTRFFVFQGAATMSTQAPTFIQPLQSVVALEGSAAMFQAQVSGKKHSSIAAAVGEEIDYISIFWLPITKPRVETAPAFNKNLKSGFCEGETFYFELAFLSQ